MKHQEIIARRLIAQVRRSLPGIRYKSCKMNWDTALGVGFQLGRKRHGVMIGCAARRLPSQMAKQIVAVMRAPANAEIAARLRR